ncbi:SLC13 family permease [Vibrio sp. TH_r3]|uniref:SLC13 family permease n=1 Tax=Vibrio sp. TH_r3 TaxID=3082084 RepID=UPI0029529B85|nr:SLC13 family permease [Vibrio sp. TH_r3]MDV7104202.1 SLC13 family permease [Vibrio sp. TH_r3]
MLVTSIVIISLLAALVFSNVRPSLLFIGTVIVLYITDNVSQQDVLGNIVNTSVLTLISLMLASLVLEKTQLLTWISSKVFRPSYRKTIFRLGIGTAISSALLNNTAVVATMMSGIQRNQEHAASRLLMPLSYFAIVGGTITLIGTSTNLIVNALIIEQGLPSLSFFSFLPVGLLLFILVGCVIALSSYRLKSSDSTKDNTDAYFIDAEVLPNSKLIGKSVIENRLRALDGLFLAEIVRGDELLSPVAPNMVIQQGDKLIFTGDVSQVKQLNMLDGVEVFADSSKLLSENLIEVIVSPESILIGRTLKNTEFRSRFDAAVVAIKRQGQKLSGKLGEQSIFAGDKLVLAVGQDFSKRQNLSRNFFILTGKQLHQPLSIKANFFAIGGFIAAILVSVVSSVSLLEMMALYLIFMVASDILDGTTLRRRFPFELWLILVCALSIAQAFRESGLADFLSDGVFSFVGSQNPYFALVILFIVTVLLTETITNTAAAAITLPIGLSLATAYNVSTLPFIMAVAYAASASFISPFGYQTNLMVMNAGGYKVMDFIKTGWKVSLVYTAVSLCFIPLFFPF